MSEIRNHGIRTLLLTPEKIEGQAQFKAGHWIGIEDEKLKHLKKVLRLDWGVKLRIIDGNGLVCAGELIQQGGRGGVLIHEVMERKALHPKTVLYICISKNSTMDEIVEKAVECGVDEIVPVLSSRSVVRPDSSDMKKYITRWQKIMDEACEQSERVFRASVLEILIWNDFMVDIKSGVAGAKVAFVSELRERPQKSMASLEQDALEYLKKSCKSGINVLVGPEGGFSEKEITDIVSCGFYLGSLGENVLRVETAVVSALTRISVARAMADGDEGE